MCIPGSRRFQDMATRLLGAALAVSLLFNVWLVLSRGERVEPQPQARSASTAAASQSEEHAIPGIDARASVTVAPVATDVHVAAEVAELRARVKTLEAFRKEHLPANQRFEEGTPDPGSRRRIEGELQRVLGADGGTPWNVECRDEICKVDVIADTQEQAHAQISALQADPALRPLVAGYAQFGSTPTQDVVTGKPAVEMPSYLYVRSDADAKAMAALLAVTDAFKASSAVRDCTDGFAQKGTVKLIVTLDPSGTVQAQLEGAGLAQTSAGACLRDRLLALARAAQMPAPETEQTNWLFLQSPPAP